MALLAVMPLEATLPHATGFGIPWIAGTPVQLVILIGLQASGKSTFARQRFEATHAVVSKDRLRNNRRPSRRQAQLIADALGSGRSVVVDNTNGTREARAALIAQARQHGAAVIGYYFTPSVADSLSRNAGRVGRDRVPAVAIYTTAKRLELPARAEGFDELHAVRLDDSGFAVEAYHEGPLEDRGA